MDDILKPGFYYDQRLPSASDAQSTCAAKAGRFNSDLHFPSLSRGLGSKTWKAAIINFERSFDLVFLFLFPPAGSKTLILGLRVCYLGGDPGS